MQDVRDPLVDPIPGFERPHRRRRAFIAGTAVVAVLGAGLLFSFWDSPSAIEIGGVPSSSSSPEGTTLDSSTPATVPRSVTEPPGTVLATGADLADRPVPAGFDAATAPNGMSLPSNGVTLWTGTEILLWGGQNDSVQGTPGGEPGLAYNPETQEWRELPPAPASAGYGAGGVWTGTEMIVCCGTGGSGASTILTSAAAYDPATNEWRTIADPPISSEFTEAVWTGSTMVIATADAIATYEPRSDEWTVNNEPPEGSDGPPLGRLREVVWTGAEVIIWPAEVARRVSSPLAYDPRTDSWRILPDPPAWPAAPDVVWTGELLVAWGGLPASTVGSERAVGSMYNPTTNSWSAIPEFLPEPLGCECNLGSQSLVWTGEDLMIFSGNFASGSTGGVSPNAYLLSFDPNDGAFRVIGDALDYGFGPKVLMAGDRVVFQSDRLYISNDDFGRTNRQVWGDERLSAQYAQCVTDAGFEQDGAQVLFDKDDVPWWVKTGLDVPAEIHGPCFAAIGGKPIGLSSHGN